MIYLFKEKKKKANIILFKLFKHDNITSYYEEQLLNKVTGYRAYLLSIIKFGNKYSCISKERRDTYLELIRELERIINILEATIQNK